MNAGSYRHRKSLIVLSIVLLVSLVACTPAQTATAPPATLAPTAAPATAIPATEAPTDVPKPEKLTVLCGAAEDWCQAMTKAFEAKTGIKTSYVRMSSGEALARIRASKDAPEFSIWHGGPADAYIAATNEGLFEPYVSPNAAQIPVGLRDPQGHWSGVYVGTLGFCSNQDVLAGLGVGVPQSWADLLDPKLKGQVAMAHPATSGTAFTAVWAQITLNGGDVEKGFAYFRQLHNNILQYTKSGSAAGPMAGRGEIGVAIIFSADCVKFNEEGMSSLVVSFPSEGTGYEVGGVAVIKGGPEPEAARMYVDWALTAEAQEIPPTVKAYELPTNPGAQVSDKSVRLSEVNLVDYDFIQAGENRKLLAAKFDAEIAPAPKE